ncbi:hypothetical protein AGR1A_Cc20792 [Agrobacterium fabacearum CFBP 5771]|nr:hypothetical protein AGR1A_Cc20792 [Agrobacterium fabacearum CFBP 5771]
MGDKFRRLAEANDEKPVGARTLRRNHVEYGHGLCGKARNLCRPFKHAARIGFRCAGSCLRLTRGLQHNGKGIFKRGGIGERNIEFGGHVFLLFMDNLRVRPIMAFSAPGATLHF